MVTNPIWINTVVVFVRLYWFEKRFQDLVKETMGMRRTRSRARTETKDLQDHSHEERGVNGRRITVLHNGPDGQTLGNGHTMPDIEEGHGKPQASAESITPTASGKSSEVENEKLDEEGGHHSEKADAVVDNDDQEAPKPEFTRDIRFGDLAVPDRRPTERNQEQHIAFLENQRNPKDRSALRIPGPRDYDRGEVPEAIDDGEDGGVLDRSITAQSRDRSRSRDTRLNPTISNADFNGDDHGPRPGTAPEEPEPARTRVRRVESIIGKFRERTNTMDKAFTGMRNRTRTSQTQASNHTIKDPMPYLSYTPTIGRNSAFVDLSEEQREELGGIEYRSLKTLAAILVSYFIGMHLFGVLGHVPWIYKATDYGDIIKGDGQGRAWW
jgi:Cation transport protein